MGCKSSEKPKPKHRKGLWSPEEDQMLRNYVLKYGHGCWSSVPVNAGLQRNGKSCRLRWMNYLRPGLKRGAFSKQEEETILTLHRLLGNKWSQMAQHLPGRTDNEIKNYWHSYLKSRVLKAEGIMHETHSDKSTSPSKMELSQPSEPTTPVPSYNDISEKSTSDSCGQPVPDQLFDSSLKEATKSSLPKLMFAEWLSLDTFAGLGDQGMVSNKGLAFDHTNPVSFQDSFMNGDFLFYEETFGSDYQHSLSDHGSAAGDLFGSQSKFEVQSSASDHQFVDFSSGDGICSDFNVYSDVNVMYI